MRQLKYVNAKVLGFVVNSADEESSPYNKYYRKVYGKNKYGYYDGSSYGYGGNQLPHKGKGKKG